jgi:hypothetical protein
MQEDVSRKVWSEEIACSSSMANCGKKFGERFDHRRCRELTFQELLHCHPPRGLKAHRTVRGTSSTPKVSKHKTFRRRISRSIDDNALCYFYHIMRHALKDKQKIIPHL